MQLRKDYKKNLHCMKIVPTLFSIYRQLLQLHLPLHPPSTIHKGARKDGECDSNINKAKHGCNISMHAINKHPVNNRLRLNKVFV